MAAKDNMVKTSTASEKDVDDLVAEITYLETSTGSKIDTSIFFKMNLNGEDGSVKVKNRLLIKNWYVSALRELMQLLNVFSRDDELTDLGLAYARRLQKDGAGRASAAA